MSDPGESELKLRIVARLSDIKVAHHWHSLQFSELADIKPRVGHSLISIELGKILMIGGGNHDGALQEIYQIDLDPEHVEETQQVGELDSDPPTTTFDSENVDVDKPERVRVKDHPVKSLFEAKYEFFCAEDKSKKVWTFGGANTKSTTGEVVVLGNDPPVLEVVKCSNRSSEESEEADSNANEDVSNSNEEQGPCPRTQGSNSAIIEQGGKEYLAVFAGGMKGEQPVNDRNLYLFDTVNKEWETVKVKTEDKLIALLPFSCQPPVVQGHVMTAIGSKILVHGGINNLTLYDGFHCIDLNRKDEDLTCSWMDCSLNHSSEKPSGRAAHGIAKISDVIESSPIIYMFGGLGKNGPLNDLWSFDFETLSWSCVLKNHGQEHYGYFPLPRLDFGMCSVGIRERESGNLSTFIIIHGGMNPKGELYNDAWVMKVDVPIPNN